MRGLVTQKFSWLRSWKKGFNQMFSFFSTKLTDDLEKKITQAFFGTSKLMWVQKKIYLQNTFAENSTASVKRKLCWRFPGKRRFPPFGLEPWMTFLGGRNSLQSRAWFNNLIYSVFVVVANMAGWTKRGDLERAKFAQQFSSVEFEVVHQLESNIDNAGAAVWCFKCWQLFRLSGVLGPKML